MGVEGKMIVIVDENLVLLCCLFDRYNDIYFVLDELFSIFSLAKIRVILKILSR